MNQNLRDERLLGAYLRECRARLDPTAFGLSPERRRTPGLRREEIAQRANISPTWYTWIEQGRGGAPSADVLDRITHALLLTDTEREHVFMLGLGRPPDARYQENEGVSPRLQRVLDALNPNPALIRTAIWNVIAWNQAATVMLGDYAALPPARRNVLRIIFLDPVARSIHQDWESVARHVVSAFRVEAVRAGAGTEIKPLVEELCDLSPEFRTMWRNNDIQGGDWEAVKKIHHPDFGPVSFEYSAFAVDGRTDLSMIVYNPLAPADVAKED